MKYAFCAQTHPGRARSKNEDSVTFDEAARMAVLADGMGGYKAGEVASAMATSMVLAELMQWLTASGGRFSRHELRTALEVSVGKANYSIYAASRANPDYAGMGTTLVVGIFHADQLLLGHVGDSRCYRLRGSQLQQITKDHSLLQEQLDAGLLTPAQVAASPLKNLVTRALGVDHTLLLEINEHRVHPGDLYLMCSDGLTDMIDDATIATILKSGNSLRQVSDELVLQANRSGGRDNITVLLTQALEVPDKRSLVSRWLGMQ